MTSFPDREAGSQVAPFILNRWSPRAFTPDEITQEGLLNLLDAGRWAPSAYNAQPWRFIYACRNTPSWERFLSWLIPFNRGWAENASAIVYIASRTVTDSARTGEPVEAPSHAFDAGAASVLIQLQANQNGWHTHPVSGFDKELAHAGLELPADHVVHAALVIGHRGSTSQLPENLQEREKPSPRLPLDTLASEGRFIPSAPAS
ncbi:nitroreductase family protein [Acetobacter sp.]|jgi:nitroreductase|uniref:nitroreductase family protein n=1 Tax=Acetobacter sp. TaxID=440 RepID=UPI0025C10C67|nr:nitroreductase family protein [Acetobacter sp.]MCH4092670.1 nitroreductase family protein [Acetobacter sp.]MCI1301228.1 nitroreductase family protein [Acetobacter sp.]MCI1317489.1 nitroreductase family protein [Acetobacter sp.]